MPSTYKTPGVYVEEISIFPPSVASVETAVPAFIGYTEKASKGGVALNMKPTRIKSMVEFKEWFGSAPPRDVTAVLDDNDEVDSVDSAADYYLYDCLRMYFSNGGGKCYIVSVGTYSDSVDLGDESSGLLGGLKKLEKEDEPTIILSPDATLLDSAGTGLADFQKAALAQCNKLQDRVVICDTKYVDDDNLDDIVQDFRNGIGIQYLKYGAAYTPWLKTSLQHDIKYRNLSLERDGGGSIVLKSLTDDADIKDFITNKMDSIISVVDGMIELIDTRADTSDSLTAELNSLIGDVNDLPNSSDEVDYSTAMEPLYSFIRDAVNDFINAIYFNGLPEDPVSGFTLQTGIQGILNDSGLDTAIQELVYYSNGFKTKHTLADGPLVQGGGNILSAVRDRMTTLGLATIDASLAIGNIDIDVADYSIPTTLADEGQLAIQGARKTFKVVNATIGKILAFAQDFESTFDDTLSSVFGTYKNILSSVNGQLATLPPSSSIAGVYAAVDADRGVWKAPANVSLNNVIGPSARISHDEQAELNVDVNAGKSINAIRAFTGKGILVWGARTLAGNDNEWRYVSVRRFYNMVEESIKKASGQFVFEPNDANTWVKVKGMIENYLTVLWRQGALAGAKTGDAFFVKVGLGQTMTAQDILEGRMIVEIGMAVVRPAEFIILKFSHKMQES